MNSQKIWWLFEKNQNLIVANPKKVESWRQTPKKFPHPKLSILLKFQYDFRFWVNFN